MPIGSFKNFNALKGALLSRADKKIKNPDAYTASVARKMEPGFGKGTEKPSGGNMLARGAQARVQRRQG